MEEGIKYEPIAYFYVLNIMCWFVALLISIILAIWSVIDWGLCLKIVATAFVIIFMTLVMLTVHLKNHTEYTFD